MLFFTHTTFLLQNTPIPPPNPIVSRSSPAPPPPAGARRSPSRLRTAPGVAQGRRGRPRPSCRRTPETPATRTPKERPEDVTNGDAIVLHHRFVQMTIDATDRTSTGNSSRIEIVLFFFPKYKFSQVNFLVFFGEVGWVHMIAR